MTQISEKNSTKNAHTCVYITTETNESIEKIQEIVGRLKFESPTGFSYWEVVVSKKTVGVIDQNFNSGKWKSHIFGWGQKYFDSYYDAEDYFKTEYVKFVQSLEN